MRDARSARGLDGRHLSGHANRIVVSALFETLLSRCSDKFGQNPAHETIIKTEHYAAVKTSLVLQRQQPHSRFSIFDKHMELAMKRMAILVIGSATLVGSPAFAAATSATTTISGVGMSAVCDNSGACVFRALPSTHNLSIESVSAICSPTNNVSFNGAYLQFTPPNNTATMTIPLYPSNPLASTSNGQRSSNYIFPAKAYAKAGTVITVTIYGQSGCSAQIIGQSY